MADEYVPTTEEVRRKYADRDLGYPDSDDEADFDRWLAAHDAELLADTPETVEVVARALAGHDGLDYDRDTAIDPILAVVWQRQARTVLAALREHLTPALPNEGND